MSKNCKSCKNLKNRGIDVDCCFEIGDKECASLGDDKGFNGKKNDCQDMHDLNDCLLGRADSALDIHDDCDWKGYLKKLVSTLYNLQKMTICAICGIWIKIHELYKLIENLKQFTPYFRRINRVGTGIWGESSHITNFNKTKIIMKNKASNEWEEHVTIEGQASLITSGIKAGATVELTLDGSLFDSGDSYKPNVVIPVVFSNVRRDMTTFNAILLYHIPSDKWYVKNTSGTDIPLDYGFRFSLTYQQGNVKPGE